MAQATLDRPRLVAGRLLNGLRSLPEGPRWPYLFILPSFLLVAVIVVYPMLSGILLSFLDGRVNRPARERDFIGLANYARLLEDPIISEIAGVTFVFVVASAIGSFCVGLIVAALLGRPFRGVWVLRLLALVPLFLPSVVVANIWWLMLNPRIGVINDLLVRIGMIDFYHSWFADPTSALAAVIAIEVWRVYPFYAIFLLAGMQAIPHELHEAAAVDGAGSWQRFRAITWPLLLPVIVISTVLVVIQITGSPDLVYILTGGGPGRSTTMLSLYAFQTAYHGFNFGYAATIAVVLMGVMASFAVVYVRVSGVLRR